MLLPLAFCFRHTLFPRQRLCQCRRRLFRRRHLCRCHYLWPTTSSPALCYFSGIYDPPRFMGKTDKMYIDGEAIRMVINLNDSADGLLPVRLPGVCPMLVSDDSSMSYVEAAELPDTYVTNPHGQWRSIFYEPYQPSWGTIPSLSVPHSLPAVNTIEEDLLWVEQRAAAHGIVAPYQQPGFVEASVLPPPRAHAGASTEPAPFDLPPLTASGAVDP